MPKTTIGALHARFSADTRDFTKGLESVELSQRDLRKIQRDATTDTDRYNDELHKLDAALHQGKISQEQYNAALAKSKSRLKDVGNEAKEVTGHWTDFKSQVDLVAGAIGKVHAAFSAFMEGIKRSNEIESFRKSVEVTREEFAALVVAAGDIGEDAQTVRDMFRDIADAVDDILKDPKGGAENDMLNRLGITPEQLTNAGSSMERLKILRDALYKQPVQSRISLAKQLGGPEMLQILDAVEAMGGFQEALNRSQAMSGGMTDAQVKANQALARSWADLNGTMEKFFTALDAETIKELTAFIKELTSSMRELRTLAKDFQNLRRGVASSRSAKRLIGFGVGPMEQINPLKSFGVTIKSVVERAHRDANSMIVAINRLTGFMEKESANIQSQRAQPITVKQVSLP